MPRKYIPKTNGPAYSKEDLANAIRDIQNRNMSYRQAQEHYNVPIAVISQRLNGRKTAMDSSGRGRKTTFTHDTEKKIVNCLLARAKSGFPCDKDELLDLIQEYVKSNNMSTQFVNDRPGVDWYYSFLKRHKNILSLKKPEHLQKCRKDARRPDVIYKFYEDLNSTFGQFGITSPEQACFVFNADESGFKSDPCRLRAIGQKGKPLSRVSGGSGRESTTVLACVGADGSVLPPLIVFKGAGIQARWVSDKAYPGTLYAVSKNGWMEEPQFFTWFTNSFITHITNIRQLKDLPNQTAVLLYDGHASHISVRIVEQAMSNNITLIKLPSHLTDMLQPLDKCVFGPVKTYWEKKLIAHGKHQMGKGTGRLSKTEFVELLAEVWTHAIKPKNIISGFSSCGIFPVDKTKFPTDCFKQRELEEYLQKQNTSSKEPNNTLQNTENSMDTSKDIPQSEKCLQNQSNSSKEPEKESNNDLQETENRMDIPEDIRLGIPDDLHPESIRSREVRVVTPTHEPKKQSCNHLTTETCTSSCMATYILNAPNTLTKLFFKSPEKKENVTTIVKQVIPRLRQQTYGEILTNEEVLDRLKQAQEKKIKKPKPEKQKSKTLETKKILKEKTEQTKISKKKKNEDSSTDEGNNNIDDCLSDSESPWDWEDEKIDEDPIIIKQTSLQDLKTGSFVLVQFKGGKRNTTVYKYVCSVENIIDSDVEVVGLRAIDDTKQNFAINSSDMSYVNHDQILGVLPFPTIKMKGERIYYQFEKNIPVLEDTFLK